MDKLEDQTRGSIWGRSRARLAKWQHSLQPWWRDYQWVLLAMAWVVALILGYVGFLRYTQARSQSASWLDLLYLTLQLASLESGAVSPPLPLTLQIARWLLPALTLYTAVRALAGLFHEQVELARLWSIRDHVVITGGGRKGMLLAKGFGQQGDSVVVIERDEDNELLEQFREHGAIVLVGDATDPDLLRKARAHRARTLISVSGDDAVNAEVAVRAQELAAGHPAGALTCIIHLVEPRLCELLREREIGLDRSSRFRLELFNVFDRGARLMVQEVPVLDRGAGESPSAPHLLIIGMGRLGESLALYAAQMWRDRPEGTNQRLRLTVVDREAKARCESLEVRYPKLETVCELVPQEMDVRSPAFQRAEFLYDREGSCKVDVAYVCLDDDSLGLHTGLALLHRVREYDVPILVRLVEEGGLARLLRGRDDNDDAYRNLNAFGLLDRTCTPPIVLGGTHEILARALHDQYVRQQEAKKKTVEDNPSLVPWEELPEEKKESNRRQVDHIGEKLREAGCGIAPLTDWDAASFQLTPEEVERLARLEHERWCEEPKDEEDAHACLVPWEDLPEDEKDKDRNFVRKLPHVLAGVGLQIYRTKHERPASSQDEKPRITRARSNARSADKVSSK